MKTSRRLILSLADLEALEEQLVDYIYKAVFKPVFQELEIKNELENEEVSPIVSALRRGTVYFDGVGFRPAKKFGAKVAKEFQKLGATFKNGRYVLPIDPDCQQCVEIMKEVRKIQAKTRKKIKAIASILERPLPDIPIGESIIKKTVLDITRQASTAFGIKYDFKAEDVQFYVDSYIANAEMYSKKLAEKSNRELKAFVLAEVSQVNMTTKALAEIIKERYGVSERHARFIARQEAHIARERINQNTAQKLGFNYYVWQTVGDYRVRPAGFGRAEDFIGDNHRVLNGLIFSFDDPPIVDRKYGRRCNPGEDFGCRCTARVIIADDEIIQERLEQQKKQIEDAKLLQTDTE